jgi:hypothetical protein
MVCAPSAEQAMADVVSVYPTAINQNLAVLRAFVSQSMQRQNSISSLSHMPSHLFDLLHLIAGLVFLF